MKGAAHSGQRPSYYTVVVQTPALQNLTSWKISFAEELRKKALVARRHIKPVAGLQN